MNWETYKLMTNEQKEEYNFKFREKPIIFDITGLKGSVLSIMSFFCIGIMIIYMGMKELMFSQETVTLMMKAIGYGPIIFTFIAIFYFLGFLIEIIVKHHKESKWMKENKVVKIKKVLFNILKA